VHEGVLYCICPEVALVCQYVTIVFLDNGTKFRPQQFRGIVCSQRTSPPQQLGRMKQDMHPHTNPLGQQLSCTSNSKGQQGKQEESNTPN
jgi:hypothetical protein